jgi:hypothetical protein
VRSKGEALAMSIIRARAPQSDVVHSETFYEDGGLANDPSLTFFGYKTTKVRDLDWLLSTDELYHLQIKGTRSWFFRLKWCLTGNKNDYENYQRFSRLRSELLNTYLYAQTNEILYRCCETEEQPLLPMLFLDYRDLKEWQNYHFTEKSLLETFEESDRKVRRTLRSILKRVFPLEFKILDRAQKRFERYYLPLLEQGTGRRSLQNLLRLYAIALDSAHRYYGDRMARSEHFIDRQFAVLDWSRLFSRYKRKQKPEYRRALSDEEFARLYLQP